MKNSHGSVAWVFAAGVSLLSACSSQVDLGSDLDPSGSGGTMSETNATGGSAPSTSCAGGSELCPAIDPQCSPGCDTATREGCEDGLLDEACACWAACGDEYCVLCGAEFCEAEMQCVEGLCEEVEESETEEPELQEAD